MSVARTRRRRASVPARPARSTARLLFPLLIVVSGVGTYWNSLGGRFIWDDQISIVTNRTLQHLWPLSDPLSPPRETPVAGRPLVNLSFAINYALGGLNEGGYHAVNVAIHVACALLLFVIVRCTLLQKGSGVFFPSTLAERGARSVFKAPAAGSGNDTRPLLPPADTTAAVVTLLWMVHPLQSEAVNYITQRSESLMALFFLLTLYCAIRARPLAGRPQGRPLPEPSWHSSGWQALSIAACACGMMSKESMMVAPLVVVLCDWAFEFDSFSAAIRARKTLYVGLAATWVIAAALIWSQPRSTVGLSATVGPWTYLLNQVEMIGHYLRLSVWPRALVLDYGLPRPLSLRDVLPGALAIVALLGATGVALARSRAIGFLAASFFLTLAPTSSVVAITSEVGAERRMYLPFAALATLAVIGGRALIDRAGARTVRLKPDSTSPTVRLKPDTTYTRQTKPHVIAAASLTALVLVGLAVRTIARNAEYADPLTLWRTVVDRRPHGRARMALATELMTAGDHAQAIQLLRDAVSDFPDARAALGTELILERQDDEGIAILRQFVADGPSRPNRIPAHVVLAEALTSQNRLDDAAGEWRAILTMAPDDAVARAKLSHVLSAQAETALRQDDASRAERYAREAVQLAPREAVPHNLLGVALASKGHLEEALSHFREGLQIAPNDPQILANVERAIRAQRSAR
jgi:hypothetical protein